MSPRRAAAPSALRVRAAAAVLTLYKRRVSPLLPRSCRYSPTCSEYARLAILKHGLAVGCGKALWRLARCQPLAAGGIDLP